MKLLLSIILSSQNGVFSDLTREMKHEIKQNKATGNSPVDSKITTEVARRRVPAQWLCQKEFWFEIQNKNVRKFEIRL